MSDSSISHKSKNAARRGWDPLLDLHPDGRASYELGLRRLQRGDKDERIESEQREGRHGGVEGVANAKARDHSQHHHQSQSCGGKSKQRKIEVSCKKSEAASDLQHAGQGAQLGDSIAFELDDHLLGKEAA